VKNPRPLLRDHSLTITLATMLAPQAASSVISVHPIQARSSRVCTFLGLGYFFREKGASK
jgi:hypothetical protein